VKGMSRPKASVLPESSLVPNRALIRPPPDQFTHVVRVDQWYRYSGASPSGPPDGTLLAGARVVLLSHDGGSDCYVVDGRGLHVLTPFCGLVPLGEWSQQ